MPAHKPRFRTTSSATGKLSHLTYSLIDSLELSGVKVNMSESPTRSDSATRQNLKRVALRLFAERGIRDVSVREIAEASGQRNKGVIAYYFATKDKLISEILIDGAQRIEAQRKEYLKAMERDGGPTTVAEVVGAIVFPSAESSERDDEHGAAFNRFLLQLSLGDPVLIDQSLEGRWNTGYQRCLKHLRNLMSDKSRAEQNRRFVFLGSYVSSLLAQREAMMSDHERAHPTWRSDATLLDIVQTAAAILEAPPVG